MREYENIFDTLRKEVKEETGLTVSKINGEEHSVYATCRDHDLISFTPFCTTQNMSGGYSLIINTFVCNATGTLLKHSEEARNIRWITIRDLDRILEKSPEMIFPIHLNALKKYVEQEREITTWHYVQQDYSLTPTQ